MTAEEYEALREEARKEFEKQPARDTSGDPHEGWYPRDEQFEHFLKGKIKGQRWLSRLKTEPTEGPELLPGVPVGEEDHPMVEGGRTAREIHSEGGRTDALGNVIPPEGPQTPEDAAEKAAEEAAAAGDYMKAYRILTGR